MSKTDAERIAELEGAVERLSYAVQTMLGRTAAMEAAVLNLVPEVIRTPTAQLLLNAHLERLSGSMLPLSGAGSEVYIGAYEECAQQIREALPTTSPPG